MVQKNIRTPGLEENRKTSLRERNYISSVAFGDTSFLRKEAIELRYAAVLT